MDSWHILHALFRIYQPRQDNFLFFAVQTQFKDISIHDSVTHWLSQFWFWNTWNMTWPTKSQRRRQRQWQIHLENTFKEQSLRLLTFETFDQSDEETWPDQKKTTTTKKAKTITNAFREHLQRAIFETFDQWDNRRKLGKPINHTRSARPTHD